MRSGLSSRAWASACRPVVASPHTTQLWLAAQDRAHALPHELVVVGDQDSHRGHPVHSFYYDGPTHRGSPDISDVIADSPDSRRRSHRRSSTQNTQDLERCIDSGDLGTFSAQQDETAAD